jgi:hypothetical protein
MYLILLFMTCRSSLDDSAMILSAHLAGQVWGVVGFIRFGMSVSAQILGCNLEEI